MKIYFKNNHGFTIIELLVVVAIMAVLSSIVMTNVVAYIGKAKNSAIRQSVREFQKLLSLEYADNGSYTNLQPCIWVPISSNCDSLFSGAYAAKAREICKNILKNAPVVTVFGGPPNSYQFLSCNAVDNSQKYSIMAPLNGTTESWFCVGNSGSSDQTPGTYPYWTGPGCYSNP